jgi:hypothetical protein
MAGGFWNGTFTIFQALEKVLIVVGVPIAAYWTWYTFSATDTQEARVSYEMKLARAKNRGLQVQIRCATGIVARRLPSAARSTWPTWARNLSASMCRAGT